MMHVIMPADKDELLGSSATNNEFSTDDTDSVPYTFATLVGKLRLYPTTATKRIEF